MQSKQFKDTRTGEIVTQVPIMEMKYFKEVQEDETDREMYAHFSSAFNNEDLN